MHRTVWLLIAAALYFSVPVTARAQRPILASDNATPTWAGHAAPLVLQTRRNAPVGCIRAATQ